MDTELEHKLAEMQQLREEPERVITNYFTEKQGDRTVRIPRNMGEILADVYRYNGGWPRRVGGELFIDDPETGVHYFNRRTQAGLFGWLRRHNSVQWASGGNFVAMAELFAELERTAQSHEVVCELPHEPPVPGTYYRNHGITPGNGRHLYALVKQFRPETTMDRDLILAAFLTPFWGGPPGRRPAFVITSDAGCGVGKSTLVEMIGRVCGGHISISPKEEMARIKTRLLTKDARQQRIVLIDNLKSLKFSWADFESLVTESTISGHELYKGESQRPNLLTWCLTLNGVSLSADMAQRSVIIKLVRGEHGGSWLENTVKYIERFRPQIVGDIIGLLGSDKTAPAGFEFSRWATWEAAVLAKTTDPVEAQRAYLERQVESDADIDEIDVVRDYFADRLDQADYDPWKQQVWIPSKLAADWYNRAMNCKHPTDRACRRISQLIKEQRLPELSPDACHKKGRGYIWRAGDTDVATSVARDLPTRVATD